MQMIKEKKTDQESSVGNIKKVKVKVKQSHYRPGVTQRVSGIKVPRFHDNGTGCW
jgi:hypothetical protein